MRPFEAFLAAWRKITCGFSGRTREDWHTALLGQARGGAVSCSLTPASPGSVWHVSSPPNCKATHQRLWAGVLPSAVFCTAQAIRVHAHVWEALLWSTDGLSAETRPAVAKESRRTSSLNHGAFTAIMTEARLQGHCVKE